KCVGKFLPRERRAGQQGSVVVDLGVNLFVIGRQTFGVRGSFNPPRQVIPECVQFGRKALVAYPAVIPAYIAVRVLVREKRCTVQRLMNVADQVQQPAQCDRSTASIFIREPCGDTGGEGLDDVELPRLWKLAGKMFLVGKYVRNIEEVPILNMLLED